MMLKYVMFYMKLYDVLPKSDSSVPELGMLLVESPCILIKCVQVLGPSVRRVTFQYKRCSIKHQKREWEIQLHSRVV